MNVLKIVGMLVLLLSSCERKELCYSHPHGQTLQVLTDWQNEAVVPSTIKLVLYPLDGKGKFCEVDLPSSGGEVTVSQGNYQVIAYAEEYEINHIGQFPYPTDSSEQLRWVMYTPPSTLIQGAKATPERFFLARKQLAVGEETHSAVVLAFQNKTARVGYRIKGLGNVDAYLSVCGLLTGCCAALDLHTGLGLERERGSRASDLAFPMAVKDGMLQGNFCLLDCGLSPETVGQPVHQHVLQIYLVDAAGKCRKVTADVTDQFPCTKDIHLSLPDFHIELDLTGLLPDLNEGGEGVFHPEVEGWKDIELEV